MWMLVVVFLVAGHGPVIVPGFSSEAACRAEGQRFTSQFTIPGEPRFFNNQFVGISPPEPGATFRCVQSR